MKILNHMKVIKSIMNGKVVPPISCEIDPSNTCNHDCIWCINADFRRRHPVILERKIMFGLIKDLSSGSVKSITFTGGGEPLTNPYTIDALYQVKKRGMEVALATNGSLLNKDKCKAVVETCEFVRISLDGADNDVYLKFHQPKNPKKDNFDHIIENIKCLDLRS